MSVLKPDCCPVCGQLPKHSAKARKAYWALLHKISEEVEVNGKTYTAEQWHEYFKQKLLGAEEVSLPNGKTVQRARSTSSLDKDEMSDYMTTIEAFAAERGVFRDE